jgi:hypothetical protein
MPRMSITVETTLRGRTRLYNSANGNPRFTLHTDDGDFTTQSDAAVSYEITNITDHRDFGEGRRVELTMTPARRVWDVKVLD